MTGTTNLGLKKIDGTENWRNIFDYHNDSMDTLDQAVSSVENVEANFAVTIPVSGWTLSNGEYSYTWGNATITSKTSVVVEFVENADEIDVDYIEAEKVTQGVKFTAPWIPNYAISVNIKITYAAETDIAEITGDMVATDVITGAANVDEALSSLDDSIPKIILNGGSASYDSYYVEQTGKIIHLHYIRIGSVVSSTTVLTGLPGLKTSIFSGGVGTEDNTFSCAVGASISEDGIVRLWAPQGAGHYVAGVFDLIYETN